MKSTIRVDFKGPETSSQNGFDPVIRVLSKTSDDVRDGLISSFFQSLGGQSSWLRVDVEPHTEPGVTSYCISAVKWHELDDELKVIQERIEERSNILK